MDAGVVVDVLIAGDDGAGVVLVAHGIDAGVHVV